MNYPYANGQIRALDETIFDRNKFSKLIKTEKKEFIKTLNELGYGSHASNLEELINGELAGVKALLDKISPQKKYTDLFFLANDALNIKAFYKMKIFKVNPTEIFVKTGTISKEDLQRIVFENDLTIVSKDYQSLFEHINDEIKDETNPRIISAKIDNSIYKFIIDRLKFTQATSLKLYFQATIDFNNVLTLIRSKRLSWSFEEFVEMFVDGGKISIEDFKIAYNLSADLELKCFRDFYNEKITKGLKLYFETKDLNLLEHHFDSLILDIMKEYQYDSFGIGPIIYYYLKKQSEAKNIRLIYSSNEIDLIDLLEY